MRLRSSRRLAGLSWEDKEKRVQMKLNTIPRCCNLAYIVVWRLPAWRRHLCVGYACYVCGLDPRNVQSLLHELDCMLLHGRRALTIATEDSNIKAAKHASD